MTRLVNCKAGQWQSYAKAYSETHGAAQTYNDAKADARQCPKRLSLGIAAGPPLASKLQEAWP